jgi:hypothetical protein
MRNLKKTSQEELLKFLRDFELSSIAGNKHLQSEVTKTFKYYFPLLLLEKATRDHPPWKVKDKVDRFVLYFREAISDICQSIVLASAGFYKPAQLSLRSGLENWIRCIGLAEDQIVLTLKSVFELIDLVKSVPAIAKNPIAKDHFGVLRQRYSMLCGYVHTSSSAHMALTTAAGAYPRYIEKEASETFSAISEVCMRIACLFCIIAEKTYRSLHHTHFDIVSDALPKKTKAALNS